MGHDRAERGGSTPAVIHPGRAAGWRRSWGEDWGLKAEPRGMGPSSPVPSHGEWEPELDYADPAGSMTW